MKFDWFTNKRTQPEVSPGGSVILKYTNAEWSPPRGHDAGQTPVQFASARNQAYAHLFGDVQRVFDEPAPTNPAIDVQTYYRRSKDGSVTCTLVTSGMSDLEMCTPKGATAPRRVELIFYCTDPKDEYVATLRWLAHFPHDQNTWVGVGHTIPNGDPPAAFWGSRDLDTVLFLPPVVKRDATLPSELVLNGEPVHLLWVVPLTASECKVKLGQGLDAILNLFAKNRHPHVFNAVRESYVSSSMKNG